MTRILHGILQALGFIVSAGTLATDFVPGKYKPYVVIGVSAAQGVLGWYNHSFNPDGTPASVAYVAKLLILCLLLGGSAMAQTVAPPVPVDIPVTHVSISGSFNGYDSNGKYVVSNIDTFGVAIYRNAAGTQGFNASYEHIAVPDLGQRWEMGLGSYWLTLPKVKGLLFDTSNFVVTVSAGAGKLLSTTDGNRFAYTVSPSVTYPIAGHMAWTVSYQYLRATGGIAGLLNKSVQSVGTGPVIYF